MAFPLIPVIIIGVGVFMADRIVNGFLIQKQVMAMVWLAGVLAVLILVLLGLCYLKSRKGGGRGPDG